MPLRQRALFRGLVAGVAVVAALAACASPRGGGGGDRDSGSARFVLATKSLAVLPVLQATRKNYFSQEGLKIETVPQVNTTGAAVQALLGGAADIAQTGSTGVLTASTARQDIVSVAVLADAPTVQLSLTRAAIDKLSAAGVTPKSPIAQRVAALRGLKIATSGAGSTTELLLTGTLRTYGVNPDRDLTLRPIPDAQALMAAAKQKQVDGFIFSPPNTVAPAVEGWGDVWIDFAAGDVPAYAKMPYTDIVTTRDFAKNNPEALRKFVRALARAQNDINQDPAGVKQTVGPDFSQLKPQLYDRAFQSLLPVFKPGMTPNKEGFEQLKTMFNSDPTLKRKSGLTFEKAYDLSFATEAGGGQ